jgi:hypothetical protein
VADVAGVDHLLDGAHRVLDRHRRVEPGRAVDVDVVDAQPGQRVGQEVLDRLGPVVGAAEAADGVAQLARAGLTRLLDLLGDTPALVLSDLGEALAQNRASILLSGDHTRFSGDRRFHVWRWFTDPAVRAVCPPEEQDTRSRQFVADLRAVTGRRPQDPAISGLVSRLQAASAAFGDLWSAHDVAVRRSDRKTFLHPRVGRLVMDCETPVTPDLRQKLLVLTPADPSTRERLDLLRVLGVEEFTTPRP